MLGCGMTVEWGYRWRPAVPVPADFRREQAADGRHSRERFLTAVARIATAFSPLTENATWVDLVVMSVPGADQLGERPLEEMVQRASRQAVVLAREQVCGARIGRSGKRGRPRSGHGGRGCPVGCARLRNRHGRLDSRAGGPPGGVGCRARSDWRVCRCRRGVGSSGARAPPGSGVAPARRIGPRRAVSGRRARPRICEATDQDGSQVGAPRQVRSGIITAPVRSTEAEVKGSKFSPSRPQYADGTDASASVLRGRRSPPPRSRRITPAATRKIR